MDAASHRQDTTRTETAPDRDSVRTLSELAIVHAELGRRLQPSPLLATGGLVTPLLARLGTGEQRRALLPRLASGELTAALALPGSGAAALGLIGDHPSDWAGGGRAGGVQARRSATPPPETADGAGAGERPAQWRLYGQADRVLDGYGAGLLVVAAHTGGFARSRTLLFLVHADHAGPGALTRRLQDSLDPSRSLARIELRDTPAELLGTDDAAAVAGALAATGARAAVLVAAEAVGAARHALECARSSPHAATDRSRFAEVYAAVGAARSAVWQAARTTGEAPTASDEPARPGLALALALDALRAAAAETVQSRPGAGAAADPDAQARAVRQPDAQARLARAAGDELLFGPSRRLRDHAAEQAGLFGELPTLPSRRKAAV